jgi:hypothetical protein
MVAGSLRGAGPFVAITNPVETSTTIPCHCGNFAEARGSTISALADWHRLCGVSLSGVFMGTKLSVPASREERTAQWVGQRHNQLSCAAGLVGSSIGRLYSMIKGGGHTVHQVGAA